MYESFYGMTGKPFRLTPDADFFFESAGQAKALSYLGYGLEQGEGFIVITGEVGAGKSTLVAHLLEKLDRTRHSVASIVTTGLDSDELIHAVGQGFGLEVEGLDKPDVLNRIERFLDQEAREGRRCLLIVDECQNLDIEGIEELRMLSNFQLGAHPLLQTLLLGQPEFRHLVANRPELEQLRQRIIASHHLDALSETEVSAYIKHRLERVGWQGNPAIAEEVFAALYEASEGIPRKINQLMNRLLLLGAIEESPELTCEMLDMVCAEMAQDTNHGARAVNADKVSSTDSADTDDNAAHHAADSLADPSVFNAALALRDKRIAELEQAIAALAAPKPAQQSMAEGEFAEAVAGLEKRLDDQEEALRHMLSMLIELFEGDAPREAA